METCLFDIMELPEASLKKVVPKLSAQAISRLLTAYPRSIGQTLMNLLIANSSPATVQFVKEEIQASQLPTFAQIREAERELIKVVYDEHLIVFSNLPTSQPARYY